MITFQPSIKEVLGAFIITPDFAGLGAVYLPLVLAAVGIIMSIIGTFFVKVKEGGNPQSALNIGEFGSAGLMVVASYFIINTMIPESVEGLPFGAMGIFWATIAGLVAGLGVGKITWKIGIILRCIKCFIHVPISS